MKLIVPSSSSAISASLLRTDLILDRYEASRLPSALYSSGGTLGISRSPNRGFQSFPLTVQYLRDQSG